MLCLYYMLIYLLVYVWPMILAACSWWNFHLVNPLTLGLVPYILVHTMNYLEPTETAPPTTDQAHRLQTLLSEIVQCCHERTVIESGRFDLPPAELRCLLEFRNERYLTAKTIAGRLEVGKSRVTRIIQGLEDKGLIERSPDPRDQRYVLLSATPEGLQRIDKIDSFLTDAHSRVLSQMSSQQRTMVLASLEMLRSSMEGVREHLAQGE